MGGCSLTQPLGQSCLQRVKELGDPLTSHARIISALNSTGEPEGDSAPQHQPVACPKYVSRCKGDGTRSHSSFLWVKGLHCPL